MVHVHHAVYLLLRVPARKFLAMQQNGLRVILLLFVTYFYVLKLPYMLKNSAHACSV